MAKYNHKRFYSNPKQRKMIPRYEITNGMIITFRYKGGNRDQRPLVFVMDTNEYVTTQKRNFSGVNLNYLTLGEVNKFFLKVLTRARWEYSKITKMPKVDIWDEENPGVRSQIIYEHIVKKTLLNKRDCWRTYKYNKCASIEQVNFKFNVHPLDKLLKGGKIDKINEKQFKDEMSDSRYGKIQGNIDED